MQSPITHDAQRRIASAPDGRVERHVGGIAFRCCDKSGFGRIVRVADFDAVGTRDGDRVGVGGGVRERDAEADWWGLSPVELELFDEDEGFREGDG